MPLVALLSAASGAGLVIAAAALSKELENASSSWVVPAFAAILAVLALGSSLYWADRRCGQAARRMRAAAFPVEFRPGPADPASAGTRPAFRSPEDARTREELARFLAGTDEHETAPWPGRGIAMLLAVLSWASVFVAGVGFVFGVVVILGRVGGSADDTGLLAPVVLGAGSAGSATLAVIGRFSHAIAVSRDEQLPAIAAAVLKRWPEEGTDGAITVTGRKVSIDRTQLHPAFRKPAPARPPSALPWLVLLTAAVASVLISGALPIFS
ncbi:hypothetical protein [Rathayibacter sp. AY1A7]|uniref:hypothetical protein n=2 Tax=unclassified Rathayibacter TaxID=2609250 RepID=UPI000CE74BC5|nr:hypothetical protein [Rathayibacter sp. AY1A7]PPF18351.1 hypothetical protein C5B95_12170 [Rathayibacter sp. AY1A7]